MSTEHAEHAQHPEYGEHPMAPAADPRALLAGVPCLREMVERIVAGFHPLRVVLFGSWARGEATRDSDVDLLVVLPAADQRREIATDIHRALADLPMPKDVVVTTPEEIARRGHLVGTVLRPALREGSVVYEADQREQVAVTASWMRFARDDLSAAEGMSRGGYGAPRHVCFFAQQAAEKALKAALVFRQIDFPRTHDLNALRDLLPVDSSARGMLPDLTRLSEWAVRERYPGSEPATPDEIPVCLAAARAVVDAVARDLADHGFVPPSEG